MKKNLLKRILTAVALGIITTAWAQTNPVAGTALGPRITFATPVYDFGKVDSGKTVEYDFIFTNTGDQLLEVRDVHPGCGCTTAGAWDKQVEPGKTGKIPIQFHSNGYGGPVQKVVSVACNDPTQGSLTLQLKGVIWRAFDVSPSYVVFSLSPESRGSPTNVVRISSNLAVPVTVSDPTCSNPAFNMQIKTVSEGKQFELRVTLAEPVPTNSINASIKVKTSDTNMPEISIMAYAQVHPLLTLMPSQIAIPPGPLPGEQQFTVTIQNNSTNPLALSEPAINVTNVEVKLEETQPGQRFNLTMAFPIGFQNKPGQNMEATVKSSNPKYPLIKIPVHQ